MLLILVLAVSALPGYGQAAQAKQPQIKTQAEFTAYTALYNEKDPAKKADLGEKFLTDFKESEMIPNAYRMILGGYAATNNWAKVLDAADRAAAWSGADDTLKEVAYTNAMIAAQNQNNADKILSYGDKVLALNPNSLQALLLVSGAIPVKYPNDKAQLDKAADLATKALAGIQPMMAKATAADKAQLVPIDGTLHGTLGLVAFNKQDYAKSIQEYEKAIKDNPKDDAAHFYLGFNYLALMAKASKDYQTAFKAESDAIAAKADQPTIDDLKAKTADTISELKKQQDKAIDELAIAVAIGGPVAQQAKTALTTQWMNKNNSDQGMDQFIASKRAELGQ
jgi:tetratricopeptide (TPR) repeat protein